MKLIDKNKVVAKIKRFQDATMDEDANFYSAKAEAEYDVLCELECFLDTLEVKEVKEPTASDRGMAEEIIINLKRIEQDYCINLTKEMQWLRDIVKKGE